MKLYPREPDLRTIYQRIEEHEIDLQPDFQRDLVWNIKKKQCLIDTILRGWNFPPVFLVVPNSGGALDVLDGQQRLNAILEFFQDKFPVDGYIEPMNPEFQKLNGLRYSQLPDQIRSTIGRYSLRVYELYDYQQDEPYELFFRLNQGTALTPAEKRNTLYGAVREQVRDLVSRMESNGLNIEKIGFNNNRLSYQDVISRLLFALQHLEINKKITDQMLVDFFRKEKGIDARVFSMARQAIDSLTSIINRKAKLNKSTLLTWLIFLSYEQPNSKFFYSFDVMRISAKDGLLNDRFQSFLLTIYQDKSSSSVNDAIPVQLRLLIIYLFGLSNEMEFSSKLGLIAEKVYNSFKSRDIYTEDVLVEIMIENGWSLK